MAIDSRHAAWQTQRTYAVRLLAPGEAARDLVDGLDDYADAFDFAKEWLYRLDATRDESTRVVILETNGGATREVWSYPAEESAEADGHDNGQELVKVFGFNPATWKSSVREFSTDEPKQSLRDRITTAGTAPPEVFPERLPPIQRPETKPLRIPFAPTAPSAPSAPSASSTPAPPTTPIARPVGKREPTHRHPDPWQRVVNYAKRAWIDRVARVGLILAIVSFWFALVTTDFRVLLGVLVGVPLVWHRLKREPEVRETLDDWS
jgi:hypothetical protein